MNLGKFCDRSYATDLRTLRCRQHVQEVQKYSLVLARAHVKGYERWQIQQGKAFPNVLCSSSKTAGSMPSAQVAVNQTNSNPSNKQSQ